VKDLSHPTEFDGISFTLHAGEILGFYGLVGAGRSEVMQALFGLTKPSRGSIALDGKPLNSSSPADAIEAGIVYVPEERGKQGVVVDLPIFQNVALPSLKKTSRNGFLQLAREFALTRQYTQRLDLRAASLSQNAGTLSGGNQQKVVIAKWLATKPRVIILDEPTKGIDIGSKAAVHAFMAELVAEGLAVIMVSSELPEVMGMSDRIVVMRSGRMVELLDTTNLTADRVVRLAIGVEEAAA
jgi:rhamnose transport system ATP-binding protein